MTIIANNFVIANKSESVSKTRAATEAALPVSAAEVNNEGHAIIVNGKRKPIGKKSAYLLDMLTLDDE